MPFQLSRRDAQFLCLILVAAEKILIVMLSLKEILNPKIEDKKILELMCKARYGEISVGEFRKRAEQYFGVMVPRLPGLNENLYKATKEYSRTIKGSGIPKDEYLRRVEIINKAEVMLEAEHVHERYAKSGRLTI